MNIANAVAKLTDAKIESICKKTCKKGKKQLPKIIKAFSKIDISDTEVKKMMKMMRIRLEKYFS